MTSSTYYSKDQLKILDPAKIPHHIAMILDGNRRWAKKNAEQVSLGHKMGADILLDILKAGKELGVKVMTLFVFSTENWNRDRQEVMGLMWLFESYIRKQIPEMVAENIRFETIGDISKFPPSLLTTIAEAKSATKNGTSMDVVFAMNYGARDELKRAFKKMIESGVQADEVSEEMISSYLDTQAYKDPELLIRTSGQMRISNFLLWQLSYTELFMTETLWPDFTPAHLLDAVVEYQQRERRHGI